VCLAKCGQSHPLDYQTFRTGLTYGEAYSMLWVDSKDSSQWHYKGRHTVLGLWHMIKQQMYGEYLHQWDEQHLTRKRYDRKLHRQRSASAS